MAIREKLRERVQPLLEPGEQIQTIFLAQTGPNPNLMFVSEFFIFWTKYDIVVVTNRRIGVFRASKFRPAMPRKHIADHARDAKLAGSPSTIWGSFKLDGKKYYVHRRFRKDVRAADDALAGAV